MVTSERLRDLPSGLRRALARADAGKTLSVDEASWLLGARGEALDVLCRVARRVRDGAFGRRVTYSRKVFVPLTHLCRDACGYCTFAWPPKRDVPAYLSPEQVLEIARAGQAAGCKEALFTLGDRPEERYPAARQWLEARGYHTTLEYLRAVAITVIEETGLIPHLNPGVMSWADMATLKHVSGSMGLMLESASERLGEKGGPHWRAASKVPAVRLRTIEDAGRLAVPFTSGILIGIGETDRERAEAVLEKYSKTGNPRLSASASFRGLNNASDELITGLDKLARRYGTLLQTHACFSYSTHDSSIARGGLAEAPPVSLALWERFLVYGIAFGIADRVLQAAHLHMPEELAEQSSIFWISPGGELGSVLLSLTYPDGEVVSYTYDGAGKQQAIHSTPAGGAGEPSGLVRGFD